MNAEELFINAIDHWRYAKGIGTALIPHPLNDKAMMIGVLQKVYASRDSVNTLIVTSNSIERNLIQEYLTNQENVDNNNIFKKLLDDKFIRILTSDYIKVLNVKEIPFLVILYHPDELHYNLFNVLDKAKFKLVILNAIPTNQDTLLTIYSICPLLNDFKQNEIDLVRTSTPVEETRIGVDIPEGSAQYKLLQYYTEYITTSISIFGSFDNIQYARVGDPRAGMSAMQFCNNLAIENGWDEHLDMSVDYNVQLDSFYNPNNIRDRASQTYDMIRNRNKLLANYTGKLEEILNIVNKHSGEHILIINKYGEFASEVTKYLNDMSENTICGNYHDKVDSIPATTLEGNPIFIKSGPHKGERKMIAAKAQKTLNEERFNNGIINVLSTNNAPDKDLTINVDVIIITSPDCGDIESYLYRLSNINFNKKYIELYTIYITNSIEEKKLFSKSLSETHTLKENVKNENNLNFIVVD